MSITEESIISGAVVLTAILFFYVGRLWEAQRLSQRVKVGP